MEISLNVMWVGIISWCIVSYLTAFIVIRKTLKDCAPGDCYAGIGFAFFFSPVIMVLAMPFLVFFGVIFLFELLGILLTGGDE